MLSNGNKLCPRLVPCLDATVRENKHAVGPKDAFPNLLDCGAALFPELSQNHRGWYSSSNHGISNIS